MKSLRITTLNKMSLFDEYLEIIWYSFYVVTVVIKKERKGISAFVSSLEHEWQL